MTNENRIDKKFSLLRDENKKALITFITFGDPDIETSKKAGARNGKRRSRPY